MEFLFFCGFHCDSALRFSPLRTLDLSYNRIKSTRGLDSLYQLRELRLTCNKLTSIMEINCITNFISTEDLLEGSESLLDTYAIFDNYRRFVAL